MAAAFEVRLVRTTAVAPPVAVEAHATRSTGAPLRILLLHTFLTETQSSTLMK